MRQRPTYPATRYDERRPRQHSTGTLRGAGRWESIFSRTRGTDSFLLWAERRRAQWHTDAQNLRNSRKAA